MNNWNVLIENYFSDEQISEQKEIFAKLMAKYNCNTEIVFNDPEFYKAFNGDTGCRLLAINNWAYDPDIKIRIAYYRNEGADKILPTRNELARMYLDIANKAIDVRDKILALNKYSELMGFNGKDNDVVSTLTNNVLLIKDNGNTSNWEEKLLKQQYEIQQKADEILDD